MNKLPISLFDDEPEITPPAHSLSRGMSLDEMFKENTRAALGVVNEILQIPVEFANKDQLKVLASVATQQISAQLKSDDTAVKARAVEIDYYDRIMTLLAEHRSRK